MMFGNPVCFLGEKEEMLKNLLRLILAVILVSVFAGSALAGIDTGVIQPVPPGGTLPGEEPPEPPEPEPDQPVNAAIDIKPETFNKKSNGKYITVYMELEDGYEASDIVPSSVRITAVGGIPVEPVYALSHPVETGDYDSDGNSDLMVKFSADDIRGLVSPGEALVFDVRAETSAGLEVTGSDSVRTIEKGKTANADAACSRTFSYNLQQNLPSDAIIKKATVRVNYKSGSSFKKLWTKKNGSGWKKQMRVTEDYYFMPAKGDVYEWDVTESVVEDWNQNSSETSVIIDYTPSKVLGPPSLIVVYESFSSDEDNARKAQQLVACGPKYRFTEKKKSIKLYYDKGALKGGREHDLKIYGWNDLEEKWEAAEGCILNPEESSIVTPDNSYTQYQIMFFSGSSSQNEPEQNSAGICSLGQNFPNPFNPATTINYSIARDCHVTLRLYNIRGQRVATIVDEFQTAGDHSVYFDAGEDLSRGIYYYQIKAGDYVDTKRMVILK